MYERECQPNDKERDVRNFELTLVLMNNKFWLDTSRNELTHI